MTIWQKSSLAVPARQRSLADDRSLVICLSSFNIGFAEPKVE